MLTGAVGACVTLADIPIKPFPGPAGELFANLNFRWNPGCTQTSDSIAITNLNMVCGGEYEAKPIYFEEASTNYNVVQTLEVNTGSIPKLHVKGAGSNLWPWTGGIPAAGYARMIYYFRLVPTKELDRERPLKAYIISGGRSELVRTIANDYTSSLIKLEFCMYLESGLEKCLPEPLISRMIYGECPTSDPHLEVPKVTDEFAESFNVTLDLNQIYTIKMLVSGTFRWSDMCHCIDINPLEKQCVGTGGNYDVELDPKIEIDPTETVQIDGKDYPAKDVIVIQYSEGFGPQPPRPEVQLNPAIPLLLLGD